MKLDKYLIHINEEKIQRKIKKQVMKIKKIMQEN